MFTATDKICRRFNLHSIPDSVQLFVFALWLIIEKSTRPGRIGGDNLRDFAYKVAALVAMCELFSAANWLIEKKVPEKWRGDATSLTIVTVLMLGRALLYLRLRY